jgi:hypothetical protein
MMSIAASFTSVKKPRFIVLGEERQTTEGDACYLATASDNYIWRLVQAFLASCNAEPANKQPSTLFPTCDEVVNLTGLLETKVMSVSSGKQ